MYASRAARLALALQLRPNANLHCIRMMPLEAWVSLCARPEQKETVALLSTLLDVGLLHFAVAGCFQLGLAGLSTVVWCLQGLLWLAGSCVRIYRKICCAASTHVSITRSDIADGNACLQYCILRVPRSAVGRCACSSALNLGQSIQLL